MGTIDGPERYQSFLELDTTPDIHIKGYICILSPSGRNPREHSIQYT
jgi:hypothetical protein